MDTQGLIASDPPPGDAPAPNADVDAARLRGERHLAVLDQLMEAALRLALTIERQATQPEVDEPKVVEGDVALAFSRASRAVRMTVLLQARLIEEMRAAGGGEPLPPREFRVIIVEPDGTERPLRGPDGKLTPAPSASPAAGPPPYAPLHSTAEVAGVLRSVAQATLLPGELSPRDARETVERITREGVERLESEHEFEALMRRPVSEIVALICRDIGLGPDWPRLAEEAWALAEMQSGQVGAPLAHFSSPAGGGGGPRSGGGGAGGPDAPSVTAHSRRATFPAGGEGDTKAASP